MKKHRDQASISQTTFLNQPKGVIQVPILALEQFLNCRLYRIVGDYFSARFAAGETTIQTVPALR
jgi:hypothetical protein